MVAKSSPTTFTEPDKSPAVAGSGGTSIADIAVFLSGLPRDECAIAYGETLATAFGAHLDCHFLNPIPTPILATSPGAKALAAEFWRQAETVGSEAETALRVRLERLAPSWELRRSQGALGELCAAIIRQCGVADLAIQARSTVVEAHDMQPFEAILFEARSPIILVPDDATRLASLPSTILIGFRETPECARAIAAALPFLERSASVILASIAEDGAREERRVEPINDMARHLARHGVAVEIRELPVWKDPAEGLIKEAKAVGAELIVAGAYGHSRLREYLFGGVTRQLIRDCPLPLLMAH
ncbi:universal stress protein [Jiella mangrovi]|uniref:Universal stress protein n=1 Tax=Jiella mangrovi TaxID=2821407 RepID=A0ABS4BL46_9HYPH|nr:universal stress protein [Jiella mangrovi]MBP0617454.1 universal stress protein [Jiella mangrovi]